MSGLRFGLQGLEVELRGLGFNSDYGMGMFGAYGFDLVKGKLNLYKSVSVSETESLDDTGSQEVVYSRVHGFSTGIHILHKLQHEKGWAYCRAYSEHTVGPTRIWCRLCCMFLDPFVPLHKVDGLSVCFEDQSRKG